MDPPNLVTLPVEIALLIAKQLLTGRDVVSLMQVYLVSKRPCESTNRSFQRLLLRINYRVVQIYRSKAGIRRPYPAFYRATQEDDVEIARLAMAEYEVAAAIQSLFKKAPAWSPRGEGDYFDFVHPSLKAAMIDHRRPSMRGAMINDSTPLMMAVAYGNIDILEAFLETCFKVADAQDFEMRVFLDQERTVYLDMSGVHRDNPNKHAFFVTVLDLAAYHGRLDMVQLLVDAGATVHWTRADHRWNAPCTMASLRSWGPSLDMPDEQRSGRLAVLNFLLDQGQPLNALRHPYRNIVEQKLEMEPQYLRSVGPGPPWFTSLWHTIWTMEPKIL